VEERLLLQVRQLRKHKRVLIKIELAAEGVVAPNETRPRMLGRRRSRPGSILPCVRMLREILSFCTYSRKQDASQQRFAC
jgi:hypothetical protein